MKRGAFITLAVVLLLALVPMAWKLGPAVWDWATLVKIMEGPYPRGRFGQNGPATALVYARCWNRDSPVLCVVVAKGVTWARFRPLHKAWGSVVCTFYDEDGQLFGKVITRPVWQPSPGEAPSYCFNGVDANIPAVHGGEFSQSLYLEKELLEVRTWPPWFTPAEIEAAYQGRWPP